MNRQITSRLRRVAVLGLAALAFQSLAQTSAFGAASGPASGGASGPASAPHNVAQLSVSSFADAPQDMLSMTLATTRDGSSAAAVQAQLSQAVEAALSLARQAAQPGKMEARTGNFSLQPRYSRDGLIAGWQGTAQVLLEGRDFALISALAGRVSSLSVSQVSFSLSPELQTRLQADAQAQAIAQFRRNAEQIARGFGLSGYTVREVSVNQQDAGPWSHGLASVRMAAAEAPVPVEAGKGSVSVTVSGSVQMH